MISPPRSVLSQSCLRQCCHRSRMPRILKHPCDSSLWDVTKKKNRLLRHSLAQPRPCWIFAFRTTVQKANVDSGWTRGQQRFAPSYSQMCWDRSDGTPLSEPVIDAGFSAVVGSACSCVLAAGPDREDRSSDVCYVGDTRQSFSEKMMTTSCTHLCRIVSHRNLENIRHRPLQ